MDRHKKERASQNVNSHIEGSDDALVAADSIIQSLLLVIQNIADPIKLEIMKELATEFETGEGRIFYSQLNRKLNASNRAILKRLRELEGASRNQQSKIIPILQSMWIEKETKTNPKVNVRIYEPIQLIRPGLKLLTKL